ncbi:hypothetical protein LTR17_012382 [Elasticomyces elasticus]|nr:hypothetical protein LTR17_012382 [Elasticomyces elasticus]
MAEQKPFPFERLPAELRILIYEYHLFRDIPVHIIVRSPRHHPKMVAVTYPEERHNAPGPQATYLGKQGAALLRTNKNTYNEVVALLYAHNTLVFHEPGQFEDFSKTAKSGVPLVRKVTFRMTAFDEAKASVSVHPTPQLESFTSLQTFEWTLRGLVASHTYPARKARNLLLPTQAFVAFGKTAIARRAQFDKIHFVTRTRLDVQGRGRPGYDTAEEVLKAIKDEIEKLLIKRSVLEPAA